MNELVVFVLIYPLLFAVALQNRVGKENPYKVGITGIIMGILALVLLNNTLGKGEVIAYPVGGWGYLKGIVIAVDQLSLLLGGLIHFIGLITLLFSSKQFILKPHIFVSLVLLCIMGLNGMVLTADLFNLFVFLELASLVSYALVGYNKEAEGLEGAFKYVLMSFGGSMLVLWATALVYGISGSLNIVGAAEAVRQAPHFLQITIIVMYVSGFSVKAGLFPAHAWKADAYTAAPAPVGALLSGASSKVAIYALFRVLSVLFGWSMLSDMNLGVILATLGLGSIFIGHMLAFGQSRLKRLLTYSSIAHIGYIIIGLSVFNMLGTVGALFHMVNHGLLKAGLFYFAAVATENDEIGSLKGLFRRSPGLAISFVAMALGMAGVPPLNGFLSKWLIVMGAMEAGFYIHAAVIVIAGLMALFYYVPLVQIIFTPSDEKQVLVLERSQMCVIKTVVAISVVLFFIGNWVYPVFQEVASNLIYPDGYIDAILNLN